MSRTSGLRYGAAAAAGVAAMMLGTSCAAIAGGQELDAVVIGIDLEVSGEGSALGEVYLQAIELRVEQINQAGLLGDRKLELQVLDNRSDPPTGAENLRVLAADPAVSAIISGACDECVIRAADDLNNQGVPTISLGRADDISQPVEERPYIFKLGPNAADNAAALARELVAADATTVALVTTADRYGEDGLREMTLALDDAGIEVAVSEQVPANSDEEGAQAAAAQIVAYEPPADANQNGLAPPDQEGESQEPSEPGPDAVVVWAPALAARGVTLALSGQGYRGQLFFDASAADEPFLTGAIDELYEGSRMIFTETLVIGDVIATSPAKAARQTWYRDYTARYGTYHAFSSFAADAVQLVVNAVIQGDSGDRNSIRDTVEGARLDGITGPIRMTPQNHSGLRSQALTPLVVRGDRWRLSG